MMEQIKEREKRLEKVQHAKQNIWLTPEPRQGWPLSSCELPIYDRVEVYALCVGSPV